MISRRFSAASAACGTCAIGGHPIGIAGRETGTAFAADNKRIPFRLVDKWHHNVGAATVGDDLAIGMIGLPVILGDDSRRGSVGHIGTIAGVRAIRPCSGR